MRSLSNHFLKRPYLHIENIKLDKFGQLLGFEKLVHVRGGGTDGGKGALGTNGLIFSCFVNFSACLL